MTTEQQQHQQDGLETAGRRETGYATRDRSPQSRGVTWLTPAFSMLAPWAFRNSKCTQACQHKSHHTTVAVGSICLCISIEIAKKGRET